MIVPERSLPYFAVTERTAEVQWKGDAASVCGPAPAALLRGFPGGTAVRPGGVPVDLPAGETPLAAFAAGERVAVYCAGGAVYVCSASGTEKSSVRFARIPSCARIYDGGEAYLLSDGARSALLRAGGLTVSAIAAFDCAAFYGDRLWLAYAGEAGKVRYGAPASTDLASARGGGGEISFPSAYGQIAALLPFGDSLLLFRERGVQRLRARGDERDFELTDLFSCARIYGATVADAGGIAVWLAEDGLHAYDGSERAFAPDFAGVLAGPDQSAARGAAEGGRYYLQATARAGAELVPVLAAFSADGKAGSLVRCAAEGLTSSARTLFVAEGAVCAPSAGGFPFGYARRVYESETCEPFGRRALLREVRVRASGPFRLTARSEEGSRTACVRGTGGTERFSVQLPGVAFAYRLETDAPGEVFSLSATYASGGVR